MTLYAHSPFNQNLDFQPLIQHLTGVAELAASFLHPGIDPEWGRLAGMFHDEGKATPDWQNYLLRNVAGEKLSSPGHTTAGAIWAHLNHLHPLSYMIAGHHSGLPDASDLAQKLKDPLERKRYEEAYQSLLAEGNCFPSRMPLIPPWLTSPLSQEFFVRINFSGLIDADRLDTEAFSAQTGDHQAARNVEARGKKLALADYAPILHNHIDTKSASSAPTTVNRIRAQVVKECRSTALGKAGFYSLTVPTGGGKTLSSLEWALIHALKNNQKRIIIALPFTSIIDQTVKVFRDVFKELGSTVVLEHHSNVDPQKETDQSRTACENWDAPLIVTTQVQLFDSLFSNHPSQCRKIHNLQDAIIILDEVQSLPQNYLSPILDVLQELVDHYGSSVLLTTATQPALEKSNPLPVGLREAPVEIISPAFRSELWDRLRRVQVHWPGSWNSEITSWDILAKQLVQHDQVLAICHLKRDAQELFRALKREGIQALHLSAAMCSVHRMLVLTEVKRRLGAGEPCHLVSTQVVEAGVDIDFPVVYRAMAGLESLAQSAGRCNREGLAEVGHFYVFDPPSQPPGSLAYKLQIGKSVLANVPDLDLFAPDTYTDYFNRVYQGSGPDGLDSQQIQKERRGFRFKEVSGKFRMIPDITETVFVPFDPRGAGLLDQLRLTGPSRKLLRNLQPYGVSVYHKPLADLLEGGGVELCKGFYVLTQCPGPNYSMDFGMSQNADEGASDNH